MENIIIIGAGKAGKLHKKSYQKINENLNIYLIDSNKELEADFISLEEILSKINLKIENTLIDICTPKESFHSVILECYKLGFRNIIVEKPFMCDKYFFTKYQDLKIIMVQNYLFSKVTEEIAKEIKNINSGIKNIYLNFSKNRIQDTVNKRGFASGELLNFEIEIPHLIYLESYFLNYEGETQVLLTTTEDFNKEGVHIPKHAFGLIIAKKGEAYVTIESNLVTSDHIRKIVISFADDTAIEANYLVFDSNFSITKPGTVKVIKKGKEVSSKLIAEDDNICYFLENCINVFNNNEYDDSYKNAIINFSEEMKLYISNL